MSRMPARVARGMYRSRYARGVQGNVMLPITGSLARTLAALTCYSSDGLGFWSMPSQLDEQNTYDNVLGWAWTSGDKVSEFASTPGPVGISNIHGDTEGDDLWTHYQMFKRTGSSTNFNWAQRWRDYYVNDYYTELTTGLDSGFLYDHLYGQGLVLWGVDRGDSAALAAAEQLATLVESQTAARLAVGSTPMAYYLSRQWARFLIFACYYAQANPITRWITLRNTLINGWMASPDWEDESNSPIVWGGNYFSAPDATYTGYYQSSHYAAGRRANSAFSYSLHTEALWRAYLVTGRSDVRTRLIEMARFVHMYAHTPSYINSMVGPWWGHENGLPWHRDGAGHTNANTSPTNANYDTAQVNTLVFGHKLTGHKGMLQHAHRHLRIGTLYDEGAGGPKLVGDTEVEHYIDTQNNPDLQYFDFNKGELQYCYQLFENGGAPAVEGSWPPYSVPTVSGQVTLIGTNQLTSVKPSSHSDAQWEYATMGYYGGGALVEDYSNGGAWVVAGSGGHAVPPNIGGLIFDFQDATWKRLDNANGMPWRNNDYTDSEINGQGELVAASGQMPAPAHLYGNMQQLRKGHGGGTKGSIMLLYSLYQGEASSDSSGWAHQFNLETGLWTRKSVNTMLAWGAEHFSSIYDPAANRYYLVRRGQNNANIDYLDGNDWTWKQFGNGISTANYTETCFIDHQRHMLVLQGLSPNRLFGFDLDTGNAAQLTVSGSLSGDDQYLWSYYPPDGCYYTHVGNRQAEYFTPNTPSNVLYKLQPPAISTNPLTGTWTVSQRILSSSLAATPSLYSSYSNNAVHYNRFFYVPSLNCFAWICGDASQQVALIKP